MPKWSNSRLLKNYREIRDVFVLPTGSRGSDLLGCAVCDFKEEDEKAERSQWQNSARAVRRTAGGGEMATDTEGWCFKSKEGEASMELGKVNKPPFLSCKQSLRLQKLAHLFCTIKFIEVWQGKFSRQWSRKPATAEPSIWVNGTISWFSFYLSI